MIRRRTLLTTALAAPALAAPALTGLRARAATPAGVVVMAKGIDDIVGAFDPAESYEFTNNEVCGNVYRKLVLPDPNDSSRLVGDLAESWEVSPDGARLTFRLRQGPRFETGNPVTAEDAAFSLRRAVILNKAPGFILTQFGWDKDNAEKLIRARDPRTLELELPKPVAPTLVLYCLSATIGSVVEKAVVLSHDQGGDLGNAWLKTHSAGAGPYRLVDWQAADHIVLAANPHAETPPRIGRVVIRHVAEPVNQLLLLEKGDVDIARDLGADQLKTVAGEKGLSIVSMGGLSSMYVAMNMARPEFQKEQVRRAVKMAIDYDAIARNITPRVWEVCQSFLPQGIPGALSDRPYHKDTAQARALLAEAGFGNGFTMSLDYVSTPPFADIAQAIQADLAAIGITLTLIPGEEKQVISKTRARQHQMALLRWFPDYLDPHSNAQGFCADPDDSDHSPLKILAWRSHFHDEELTRMVDEAARERDAAKRFALYADMQRKFEARSPFVMLMQNENVAVLRAGVQGLRLGSLADYTSYAAITKG
jgi:peptide/nickel transport system substrate-binding protein